MKGVSPPALVLMLLLPSGLGAGEPDGFLDRPWGTRWTAEAISSLRGCDGQGETIAEVDGLVIRAAQTECLGYRLPEGLIVNLNLLYADIRWHSLDHSRGIVRNLLDLRRMWGLWPHVVEVLEDWREELARRQVLLDRYGGHRPVYPDVAYGTLDLPAAAQGLQGYQLSFGPADYDEMRATLVKRFGPPTRRAAGGGAVEWWGDRTIATLATDHFVVVTRAYLAFLEAPAISPCAWPTPASYPWYLQLVEDFAWARNRPQSGPAFEP
jgi:hypothetical protein